MGEREQGKVKWFIWATEVSKYNGYGIKYGVPDGSLLFGLEWLEDGSIQSGTLKIEPPMVMKKLN